MAVGDGGGGGQNKGRKKFETASFKNYRVLKNVVCKIFNKSSKFLLHNSYTK